MTSKLTRGPLFAEVHNVPDDYHFTEEELDRIIAGDMFTPRQGAIMARELQERRKAAMDSEPVAWTSETALSDVACEETSMIGQEGVVGSIPLYRHAQQPVVPEIDRKAIADKVYGKCSRIPGATFYNAAEFAIDEVEVCRAAMLQADTFIGEGAKMPPLKCLEDVKFNADCAISDPESIYASEFFTSLDEVFGEKGNYKEPVQAKVVSMLIGEVLRLHNYHPGNSPVIPDSWTGNDKANAALMMLDRIETVDPVDDDRIDGIKRIVRELAAAPQLPGSEPSTVPGDWIPVSERMPENDVSVLTFDGMYRRVHHAMYGHWQCWEPVKITHWMLLPAAPQEVKGE